MTFFSPRGWIVCWLMVVAVTSLVSLGVGAVYISPVEVWKSLWGQGAEQNMFILHEYRLPRISIGLLAGAGLAVSGAILQGMIRNPLASPDVIGITKGAGLAAVIVIILFPKSPALTLPLAAFVGAGIVAALLYLFAYKRGVKPATLALVGIALGAIAHALIQYFMIRYPIEVNAALAWLTGSLWGRGWTEVLILFPWMLILLPVAFLLVRKLDVMNLGDDVAAGLGENIQKLRLALLIVAVALAGSCVSIIGSIGFVGLVAPHMAKQLVGTKHRYVLPVSALIGMFLLLLADALGRGLVPPVEVPAGIFTALIGAPYFLYLLRKS